MRALRGWRAAACVAAMTLACVVLLFPVYWMAMTAVTPVAEIL